VGDIGQPGQPAGAYLSSPCGGVNFLELIAPRTDRIEAVMDNARSHLAGRPPGRWQPGLSPHAPYTVHPQLLAQAVALSAARRVPLAMHLAESREEIEYLAEGRGPLRDLLESRGAWDLAARPPHGRPLDELRILAGAHRALIVHGNYLDAEEIAFLARNSDRMAVVYCPRTHAWFGHDRYPLEAMLAAGVTIALGTDSRASAPDLNLLAEMRHVARQFPALGPATILQFGTQNGARALGCDREIGTLEPGKWADLAVVRLQNRPASDPYQWLQDADCPVVQTWCRGQCCAVSR
jgi:cytosine/adenosine deaminase-related metal-dependent hydrolase